MRGATGTPCKWAAKIEKITGKMQRKERKRDGLEKSKGRGTERAGKKGERRRRRFDWGNKKGPLWKQKAV
jgi:hypothetical protein